MFNWLFFWRRKTPRGVVEITADFNKMISELNAAERHALASVEEHERQIASWIASKEAHAAEALRASNVAKKVSELFELV